MEQDELDRDQSISATRRWLNPVNHEDSGAIQVIVNLDVGRRIYANVAIWDCDRKINLDFGFSTEEDYNLRRQKIDIMIEELERLKVNLRTGNERLQEIKRKREARKAEREKVK